MHNKIAHTAEHAFIGSLQKLIGETLNVRKVEHRDVDNSAFIRIPYLDLELVNKAQMEVNHLIKTGRKIESHQFESLNDAKKSFPYLRAHEDQIKKNSNSIRVIEIEEHDVAACAREHTHNLSDCDFFLVKNVSKNGNEYEITFVVEQQARELAMALSSKLLNIYNEIGANFNTVENTIKKLQRENEVSSKKLKKLIEEKLGNIRSYRHPHSKITIVQGIFCGLIDSEIRSFAGRKIAEKNTVVIIANINEQQHSTLASFVFARNESLGNIDCNKIFRDVCGNDCKGGGNSSFVSGVIESGKTESIINNIVRIINDNNSVF